MVPYSRHGRSGKTGPPPGASPVLGLEMAGVVERAGPNCSLGFEPGDRIMGVRRARRSDKDRASPSPRPRARPRSSSWPAATRTTLLFPSASPCACRTVRTSPRYDGSRSASAAAAHPARGPGRRPARDVAHRLPAASLCGRRAGRRRGADPRRRQRGGHRRHPARRRSGRDRHRHRRARGQAGDGQEVRRRPALIAIAW